MWPTWGEYEDQDTLKIELMTEGPLCNPSHPEFNRQEQIMFNYRGWFVIPTTPWRRQFCINSVKLYAYDAADIMDDENFATLLEHFVLISWLQVAQENTEKVPVLDHFVLAKRRVFNPRKHSIKCSIQLSMVCECCCIFPYQFKTIDCQLRYIRLLHNFYCDIFLGFEKRQ